MMVTRALVVTLAAISGARGDVSADGLTFKLNNGNELPLVGVGVGNLGNSNGWQVNEASCFELANEGCRNAGVGTRV